MNSKIYIYIIIFITIALFVGYNQSFNSLVNQATQKTKIANSDYLNCSVDEDCIFAPELQCDSCSCGTSVNKVFERQYRQEVENICKDYKGSVCDMNCPPAKNKCIADKCTRAVVIEDIPTQP